MSPTGVPPLLLPPESLALELQERLPAAQVEALSSTFEVQRHLPQDGSSSSCRRKSCKLPPARWANSHPPSHVGSNLRICCFAATLSLKDCWPHCLLTEDSFRPAKFRFCLGLATLLSWIRGTPWSVLLLLLLFFFFSCGAVLPAATAVLPAGTGAGLPATRSLSTTPRCLLSVLLTLFLGLSTLSPSSTTVLAWPSVELLRPSNSGNRASARACCASWRLWSPLRTLSSCFSLDLFPLLFFLGAVLPKKLLRGATRRIRCSRGYPQSTSPRRSGDQPRAPLPCDGGTPTSKHKKANQLTQTFSHCLRCTWVHKERLQMQPLQQLYTCNHGFMYRVIFLTLRDVRYV